MSQPIRSLTPKACPTCGAVGRFALINNQMTCQKCGHTTASAAQSPLSVPFDAQGAAGFPTDAFEIKTTRPDVEGPLSIMDVMPTAQPAKKARPSLSIKPKDSSKMPSKDGYSGERLAHFKKMAAMESLMHPTPVSSWVQAIYSTGLQHVRKQEWDEAIKAFRRAIDEERDFVDGHLWLARLSHTEKEQRDHLSEVLAMMPNHAEAMSLMMVLNGQMSEAEAVRALNPNAAPETHKANHAVQASAKLIKCPNCGGRMKAGDDGQSVVCEFCGHKEARVVAPDYGFKSFSMAMLKQRGQPIQWIVGDRVLKCQTCGAERTLRHGSLSERCLFCGSSYVVETDALGSFQQPDGMLRFSINKEQATTLVQDALKGAVERVKGWFINNEVGRISLETLYMPFWLFDLTLEIKRTITRMESNRSMSIADSSVRYDTLSEMAYDVPVIASQEVDHKLIERTGQFLMDQIQPYHPDLLASHSALIYRLPFDKAALDARQIVADRMRTMYEESNGKEEVRVSLLFQQIMFRLALMPFWVVTIHERDGDIRPALVNGQTGTVALGKARKPQA